MELFNTEIKTDFSMGTYKSLLSIKFNLQNIDIIKTYVMFKTNKSIIFSTISNDEKLFILKKSLNCYNEYIVSSYICNYLRKDIPNFVYCFDVYNDYLVYEFINGITLNNYIKFCSIRDFINIFLQVMFSLYFAYKRFKFTHYDLQTSNIIIKNLDKNILIRYDEKTIFTNNIAVIIDYDTSFGIINGRKTSSYKIPCAYFDIYMFINSCYIDSHGIIKEYLSKVIEFFDIIDRNNSVKYVNVDYVLKIPVYSQNLSNITYEAFFDFLYSKRLI